MWQDGLFSPTLIDRDFAAIAAAGYNPVRIFVQHPLPSMILNGDFSRLDAVVARAAAHGLRLLVTLNDDGDPNLQRVSRVDRLLATHLAGNPSIFGYDLRNEPNLADVAASIYPAGTTLPLLTPALTRAYHERVSMHDARAARAGGGWSGGGFGLFDTRKLYYYLNALSILNAFRRANPGYPAVAATPYWAPFLKLASDTLATWLGVQLDALRGADPLHLVTVGYSSRFWSALPANGRLDFRSIHMYPPADFDGFHQILRSFEVLNGLAPSPLVLEEYGVSNDQSGPQSSAIQEMATALYLRTLGGGGDIKWMFDDDAVGYNAYENKLGAVDARGVPKPTYLASAAADAYWAHSTVPAGLALNPDPVSGTGFLYVARDGLALGGSQYYADPRLRYAPAGPGLLWLDWSTPGLLRIMSTGRGSLTVALDKLTGATALLAAPPPVVPTAVPTPSVAPTTTATPSASPSDTSTPTPTIAPTVAMSATLTPSPTLSPTAPLTNAILTPTAPLHNAIATPTSAATVTTAAPRAVLSSTDSLTVTLSLEPGVQRVLSYRFTGPPPVVPIDLPAPALSAGWYMVARGHNVAPPFLTPWLALGGAAAIGLPLTEAFAYHGLPTQYFDTVALRIGPQGLTTAPIGVVALNGALPRARELPARIPHVYDRFTGHNIRGFFLDYWRRYGGLRFWGDPLSEELVVNGRPVQYFSGAEFAMTRGSHADVVLLPLGHRMWPAIRRVYRL